MKRLKTFYFWRLASLFLSPTVAYGIPPSRIFKEVEERRLCVQQLARRFDTSPGPVPTIQTEGPIVLLGWPMRRISTQQTVLPSIRHDYGPFPKHNQRTSIFAWRWTPLDGLGFALVNVSDFGLPALGAFISEEICTLIPLELARIMTTRREATNHVSVH